MIHGHRTVFPIPLGLAAAWDEDLVERAARLRHARPSSTVSRGPSPRWSTSPRSRAGAGSRSLSARHRCSAAGWRPRWSGASRAPNQDIPTGSQPVPSTSPGTASRRAGATTTRSRSVRTRCATSTCGRSGQPSTRACAPSWPPSTTSTASPCTRTGTCCGTCWLGVGLRRRCRRGLERYRPAGQPGGCRRSARRRAAGHRGRRRPRHVLRVVCRAPRRAGPLRGGRRGPRRRRGAPDPVPEVPPWAVRAALCR